MPLGLLKELTAAADSYAGCWVLPSSVPGGGGRALLTIVKSTQREKSTKICDEFCVRTSICRLLSMHLKMAIYYYFRFNHV